MFKFTLPLAAGGLIAAAAIGCSSPVRFSGRAPGQPTGIPDGLYALTLHAPDAGSITTVIAAEPTPEGFRANSRPGAVGELVGGFRGFVAPMADGRFKDGTLLRWTAAVEHPSGPVRGKLDSALGSFQTESAEPMAPITLHGSGGRSVAAEIRPVRADDLASGRFHPVAEQLTAAFAEHLYDPEALSRPEVRGFLNRVRQVGRLARDDAEFLFGVYAAAAGLRFSHVGLVRDLDGADPDARFLADPARTISLQQHDGIVTLRIDSFACESPIVATAMREAIELQPRGLIVDLRRNSGGTYAALAVAAALLPQPTDAGVLFGPSRRAEILAGRMEALPRVARVDSIDHFRALVRQHGGIRGHILPEALVYDGPVVVLTSRRTASAAEPLVDLLKSTGRATIIGERTAGAMLSSDRVALDGGWHLILPTLDYRTADGRSIEGAGVEPHLHVPPAQAEQKAREVLLELLAAR